MKNQASLRRAVYHFRLFSFISHLIVAMVKIVLCMRNVKLDDIILKNNSELTLTKNPAIFVAFV